MAPIPAIHWRYINDLDVRAHMYLTPTGQVPGACAGDALFLGNSMPIRDMDMYAGAWEGPGSDQATAGGPPTDHAGQASWVPVGANRGASGIDGVLSTAAGFAFGLERATTLVVGDVSFLHDSNGLGLLRTGACVLCVGLYVCMQVPCLCICTSTSV